MDGFFSIIRNRHTSRNANALRQTAFAAVFLCAACLFAQENYFCIRMGNGGGTGFQNTGADISLVYGHERRFFHAGGGIQYNAGDVNATGHLLFDLNAKSSFFQWTLSAGPLYHVGFPEKTIVGQDIFLCLAPKLAILPTHTEIKLFGGAGFTAMTLHGVIQHPMTFWDFNGFFSVSVSQQVGIVRFSGAFATSSYFRYDFPSIPRISAGIDVLCTSSLALGVATIFQCSEFAGNCLNTVLTDFYVQAVVQYVL